MKQFEQVSALHVKISEPFVLYDLAVVVNAVYQQIIQPTQSGKLPKRIATKLRPLLHGLERLEEYGDYDAYPDMLFLIALELGILQCPQLPVPDVKPSYQPGKKLATWAHSNEVQQLQLLLHLWQDLKRQSWSDLLHYELYASGIFWDDFTKDQRLARSVVLKYLRTCTPNQWYSVDDLLESIWREQPEALYMTEYSRSRRAKYLPQEQWLELDGEIFANVLGSSLYEMGIVNLGYIMKAGRNEIYDDDVHPDAFMLTELGAACLAMNTPATEIAAERTLIVQPNFELMLLQIDMPTLYDVLPFVQVKQIGRASRLVLARPSVIRGMVNGLTLEQMLERLRAHCQKDIPQNVEYTLNDWTRLYKGARVGQVVLIEVSSEAVADELDTPKYQSLNLRRVGPRALVTTRDINSIRNALDKDGISVTFSADSRPSQPTRATASGRYQ